MRIRYVIMSWHRMSGVARTVLTQAQATAAAGHQVEVIGAVRETDHPFFDPPTGVQLRWLVNARQPDPHDPPGQLVPAGEAKASVFTHRVETALAQELGQLRGGITVTTRPALNLLAARFAHRSTVLVGQEHVFLDKHPPDLREAILRWYPRLDALVTLTEADRADYAAALGRRAPQLQAIPNALDRVVLDGPRSDLDQPIAVALGRLTRPKGYDLLIRAWARVVRKHPEWQLRIYGEGIQEQRLRQLIERRGLTEHVHLMGATTDVYKALAEGSLFVLPSRWEGQGLAAIEAMACGLPVVAFDCPRGPAELIRSDQEGVLVPPEDTRELAGAIDRLIRKPKLRRRLAAGSLVRAADFLPDQVTPQWLRLYRRMALRTVPRRWVATRVGGRWRPAEPRPRPDGDLR